MLKSNLTELKTEAGWDAKLASYTAIQQWGNLQKCYEWHEWEIPAENNLLAHLGSRICNDPRYQIGIHSPIAVFGLVWSDDETK